MKYKKCLLFLLSMVLLISLSSCTDKKEEVIEEEDELKPVIYLYPEEEMDIFVEIEYDGTLTCTYPAYNNGWNVTAQPNGTLINLDDHKEYSYLYWEGVSGYKWDIKEGFVVEGKETATFLQEKLSYLGLEPKEYNEFIVFWLPRMEKNQYNLIYFSDKKCLETEKLNVNPKPQSIQRIHMVYKALDEYVKIDEQELKPFKREGYTLIEWGGTELN